MWLGQKNEKANGGERSEEQVWGKQTQNFTKKWGSLKKNDYCQPDKGKLDIQ